MWPSEASCGGRKLEIEFRMKLNPLPKSKGVVLQSSSELTALPSDHVAFLPCPQQVEEQKQNGKSPWTNSVMTWASASLHTWVFELFPLETVAFITVFVGYRIF